MKPSNLLINHRGEVKITDFGVSAMLNSTSSVADTFTGTYMYMSVSNHDACSNSVLLLFLCHPTKSQYLLLFVKCVHFSQRESGQAHMVTKVISGASGWSC